MNGGGGNLNLNADKSRQSMLKKNAISTMNYQTMESIKEQYDSMSEISKNSNSKTSDLSKLEK